MGAAAAGNLGPNQAMAAATGPWAPVTFAALNVLEFLGGMLLTEKAVSAGENTYFFSLAST
jgi:hypothetical protein